MRLTAFAKGMIAAVVVGGSFGAFQLAKSRGWLDSLAPKEKAIGEVPKVFSKDSAVRDEPSDSSKPLKVGVVTWGGYAGGEYFNEGFEPSENSRYWKDYKLKVQFVVIDDFNTSREAFKAGELDVLWITADSFPTEVAALKEYDPKIFFQADWSRGGDAIVARRGIQSVADLKGKKVSVAFGTPSHTFLLWMLEAGDLSYKDIEVIQAPSAIDSAAYFKAGKVDAAVVWSPDDVDCVKSIQGSSILRSTKQATHIIADVFYAKSSFIKSHRSQLKSLMEGWMIGAAEINGFDEAKRKAAKILAAGLKQPETFTYAAINNARLCNYGDNANFFNLKGDYSGVKGEDLYAAMATAYAAINQAPAKVPAWRQVSDPSLLAEIDLVSKTGQAPEGGVKFSAPTQAQKEAPAVAVKRVTISFPTGVSQLDENAKYVIQLKFGDVAKSFAGSRVRIEGNTDSVGSEASNQVLSQKRAAAVAQFLVQEYKFDTNRFIVVGNGSKKPVADNATAEGKAKNRRTDFELLAD
jgi:NitT/TauT family transport system substrate-binding protein